MSKLETPLTRRYWRETGGMLIEEFVAVPAGKDHGKRLMDGVIVLGEPHKIGTAGEIDLEGKDIILVQTKAHTLGMPLLGQALFSRHLMEQFKPRSIQTVAICTKGDSILEPLAEKYGIQVVVYPR